MSISRSSRLAVGATLAARAALAVSTAQATPVKQPVGSSACLPPSDPNDAYVAQFHQSYSVGRNTFDLSNVRHSAFTQCFPPPVSGSSVENFNSTLSFGLSVNGGPPNPFTISGVPVSVTVTFDHSSGGTNFYDTQMTQLDVNLGGDDMIRIDPTTPSTGQTDVTDLGNGLFQINSFFDVFTDLSLDGGSTWTPANAPNRVDLEQVPEPATLSILGLALVGLRALRRRRS